MRSLSRFKIILVGLAGWLALYWILILVTNVREPVTTLVIVGLLAPLNILPALIAYLRRHHNFLAITVLNVVFGAMAFISMSLDGFWLSSLLWIILYWAAWFVALIWSLTKPAPAPATHKPGAG